MNVQTRPSAPQPSVWLFIYAFLPRLFSFPAALLSSQRRRPRWKAPGRTEAREGPQGYAIPGASPFSLSLSFSLCFRSPLFDHLHRGKAIPTPSSSLPRLDFFQRSGISSLRTFFFLFSFFLQVLWKTNRLPLLKHRAHFCLCFIVRLTTGLRCKILATERDGNIFL